MELRDMSDAEFVEYLRNVKNDLRESGMEATAADYEEMIWRFGSSFIEPEGEEHYLIGQRVIVNNERIVTVTRPPVCVEEGDSRNKYWVIDQGGIKRWFDPKNLRPLPGGQM